MRQTTGTKAQVVQEDRQRHQTGDPQTVFLRRDDQDCSGRAKWRGQHCRAVPPRGDITGRLL